MSNIVIEEISPEDIKYIEEHIQDKFLCSWDEIQFRNDACSCSSRTYVAKQDALVIGFVSFRNMYDQIDIMNIVVDEEYRNKGIGNELLQFVLCKAKEMNIKEIMLEVNVNNSNAIKLYTKNKFEICSTRKEYYLNKETNTREDAYIMIFKEEE